MKKVFVFVLTTIFFSSHAQEIIKIESKYLSREIESILYDLGEGPKKKPIVYITNGNKFIQNGSLKEIEKLTRVGEIKPAYYVFTSTVDTKTKKDHRNEYFFTNEAYIDFFENELIPTIEERLGPMESKNRILIGISFGGLSAAYFSAVSDEFKHFGIMSPITYPRKKVYQDISFSENEGLRIFLSSGKNDAESYTQRLKELYESKNYDLEVLYTDGGHNFDNWNGQLKQMLNFFFK